MGIGSAHKRLRRHRLLVYLDSIFEVIHSVDPDLTRVSFEVCSAAQQKTKNPGVFYFVSDIALQLSRKTTK